jgi:transaldolase
MDPQLPERGEILMNVASLNVKIFADGASLDEMIQTYKKLHFVRGFTTNPTLMRKAGVTDYETFARQVIAAIPDRPISFEVFSDDFYEMERQAVHIGSWGDNVYVKIPVSNTAGESSAPLVARLAKAGVKQNVTAMMMVEQVREIARALAGGPSSFVSVFAGRIADSGRDPLPIMRASLEVIASEPQIELIWASPREVLNIVQAHEIGCHIITVTNDLIAKTPTLGKDLREFSIDTVKMFRSDALAAGFRLNI